jgi:hypothetical protein
VGPELGRIYSEVREAFDLPFVPTLIKSLAGSPDYLKLMWKDLGPVVRSREFHSAAGALDEFVRSRAISGTWRFSDQERTLAEQNISTSDMPVLSGVVGVFARALPRILLFTLLMEQGLKGGRKGRITAGELDPALSRLIDLRIPNERDAGLRVWLLYTEIKRTFSSRRVMSLFRALSPFPGYLASAWQDTKRIIDDRQFKETAAEVDRRARALASSLPAGDHRAIGKRLKPSQWRDIEAAVEDFSTQLPRLTLLAVVWRRSFATHVERSRAA